jgi:hypothetical protein
MGVSYEEGVGLYGAAGKEEVQRKTAVVKKRAAPVVRTSSEGTRTEAVKAELDAWSAFDERVKAAAAREASADGSSSAAEQRIGAVESSRLSARREREALELELKRTTEAVAVTSAAEQSPKPLLAQLEDTVVSLALSTVAEAGAAEPPPTSQEENEAAISRLDLNLQELVLEEGAAERFRKRLAEPVEGADMQ